MGENALLFVNEPCIVYKLSHSAYPEMKNEELITAKELEICPPLFLSGSHQCTEKEFILHFDEKKKKVLQIRRNSMLLLWWGPNT